MLATGPQLTRMFKSGWKIVTDNPSIGAMAFLTELEATTVYNQDDWVLGSTSLVELGYLVSGFTWAEQRDWMTGVDTSISHNVTVMLQGYFPYSPSLQTALLTSQRSDLVDRRNVVNNAITGVIDPWLASPPGGTDNIIIKAVQTSREVGVRELDTLDNMIAEIDKLLEEFSGNGSAAPASVGKNGGEEIIET